MTSSENKVQFATERQVRAAAEAVRKTARERDTLCCFDSSVCQTSPCPCAEQLARAALSAAATIVHGWQPIADAKLDDITEDAPVILGWWSTEETPQWQWVVAYWTGEEWDAGENEIAHCTPTHFMIPATPAVAMMDEILDGEK